MIRKAIYNLFRKFVICDIDQAMSENIVNGFEYKNQDIYDADEIERTKQYLKEMREKR